MPRAIIDEEHRNRRREYLKQHGFFDTDKANGNALLEPEPEFGELPFSTRDLYELHLHDTIKYLPSNFRSALQEFDHSRNILLTEVQVATLRSTIEAQSAATAHLTMLTYLVSQGK